MQWVPHPLRPTEMHEPSIWRTQRVGCNSASKALALVGALVLASVGRVPTNVLFVCLNEVSGAEYS